MENKQLYTAFGIVLALVLLIGVFSVGFVMASPGKTSTVKTTGNQVIIHNTKSMQSAQQSTLKALPQSLREQQKSTTQKPATHNHIKIEVQNTRNYHTGRSYYHRPYHYRSSHYYRGNQGSYNPHYRTSGYPYRGSKYGKYYGRSGFQYSNSYGVRHHYSYY